MFSIFVGVQKRERRDHAAASCHGNQFVQHTVQADDGGGFPFIEMAEDGLADIGAKLLPGISFGDNGVAEGAHNEAAIIAVLVDYQWFSRCCRKKFGRGGR